MENNKKVAAAHFSDFKLCHTVPPIASRDGDHLEVVAADDRLERHLDRDMGFATTSQLGSGFHEAKQGSERIPDS